MRFNHGYDASPLEIQTKPGQNKRMRIGQTAYAKMSGRYAPYYVPEEWKRQRTTSQEIFLKRNLRNRTKNKRSARFVDMDYSYERMELFDRMLDSNPAPPPYADVSLDQDLDTNPAQPLPNIADDAYYDEDYVRPGGPIDVPTKIPQDPIPIPGKIPNLPAPAPTEPTEPTEPSTTSYGKINEDNNVVQEVVQQYLDNSLDYLPSQVKEDIKDAADAAMDWLDADNVASDAVDAVVDVAKKVGNKCTIM